MIKKSYILITCLMMLFTFQNCGEALNNSPIESPDQKIEIDDGGPYNCLALAIDQISIKVKTAKQESLIVELRSADGDVIFDSCAGDQVNSYFNEGYTYIDHSDGGMASDKYLNLMGLDRDSTGVASVQADLIIKSACPSGGLVAVEEVRSVTLNSTKSELCGTEALSITGELD